MGVQDSFAPQGLHQEVVWYMYVPAFCHLSCPVIPKPETHGTLGCHAAEPHGEQSEGA